MNDTKLKDLIGRCQKRFSRLSKNFQDLEKNLEFLSVMSSDTYDLLKAGFDGDDVVDLRELADTLLHSANALADTASVAEWFNDRVKEVSKKQKTSENFRTFGKKLTMKESEVIEEGTLNIDMWYGDSFNKEDYAVDCTFYPNDGEYRGNIYRLSDGKIVGDYSCGDSTVIEDKLGYDFD